MHDDPAGLAVKGETSEAEQMVFVRIEAMPSEEVASREGMIGAYVNCWVASDDVAEADGKARGWVEEEGWHVVAVETCRSIEPDEAAKPGDAERIREARDHGGSLVFHKWRTGGEPVVG